jgi:hypothetical protein
VEAPTSSVVLAENGHIDGLALVVTTGDLGDPPFCLSLPKLWRFMGFTFAHIQRDRPFANYRQRGAEHQEAVLMTLSTKNTASFSDSLKMIITF